MSRIIEVRKAKNLNQEQFAKKLNLSRSFINQVETGKRKISDRTILDICREFNVNEEWLRTGEGEPFKKLSRDDELAAFLGKVSNGKDDFRKRFISALSVLSVDDWEVLEKIAAKLLEETKKDAPQSDQDTLNQKADVYSDMAREQFILEEGTGSPVSSVKESDVG